jgi:hypothetical protein
MVVHVKVMAHEISPIVIICEVPHSMLGGKKNGADGYLTQICQSIVRKEKAEATERRAAQHRGYSISEIHMISISVKSCSSLQMKGERMGEGAVPFTWLCLCGLVDGTGAELHAGKMKIYGWSGLKSTIPPLAHPACPE